jgi:hypothetical protein
MTLTIGLPAPTGAGIASMFRKGGDYYSKISDVIFDKLPELLPRGLRRMILNAVPWVVRVLEKLDAAEKLDERVTDAMIAGLAGVSVRVVQYVLWALDVVMDQAGMAIIRRIRAHGRRLISFIRGFAPSGLRGFSPPAPPIKTEETTTTSEPSSSIRSAPENAREKREEAPQELVDRACRLIPGATPIRVADAVAVYSAEWVRKALDAAEHWNRKLGKSKVKGWGFILDRLGKWKREGGPPPDPPTPSPPPAKVEPPKEEPPSPLTAGEVAELVAQCQALGQAVSRFARKQLAKALADGDIPAELMATIPAELMEATRPRAP